MALGGILARVRGHSCLARGPSCVRSGMMAVWADAIWFLPQLGTLGDGLTWGYAQTLFIRFSLAPASRRGFSCARHATGRFGTKFTSENWNCAVRLLNRQLLTRIAKGPLALPPLAR